MIAVDLSSEKELDADPRASQQIELIAQLKNIDGINADAAESMFILTIWEKIKETRLKFSQWSLTVLKIMANYPEARVKLTNTQLNKLRSAAKNKTGTILRINKKKFQDEELPHVLFLTKRQTAKIGNVFANNMKTDVKLSKAKISKIVQSGGYFGSWLANLGKKH